jgi:hypothetical protein
LLVLAENHKQEIRVQRFLQKYQSEIVGVLEGPDRVLFRGVLRSIAYASGLEIFLTSIRVWPWEFMDYAKTVSAQLKEHAQGMAAKLGRPYEFVASSRASKEEIAKSIAARDGVTQGLVCVLGCVENCRSLTTRKNKRQKRVDLVYADRRCMHLYFYYLDRDFGWMHVRLQSWFPFSIQVCINGREWLAQKMKRAGMEFVQQDNCFTSIGDVGKAQRWMDSLMGRQWVGWLESWAKRVMPWLSSVDGRKLRGYYWTVREAEMATDVMFQSRAALDRIYPALVRHAVEHFRSPDIMRFLGRRHAMQQFRGEIKTRVQQRHEGVRVKHMVQENWIKMYNKQGSVLRVETTINRARRFRVKRTFQRNGKRFARWVPLRKGVVDFRRRAGISLGANRRYLQALSFAEIPQLCSKILDPVSRPRVQGEQRYRALRPISPEDGSKLALLRDGRFAVEGIRNKELQELWPEVVKGPDGQRKTAAKITRWLRLIKAHGLIMKVPHSHCYRLTQKGQAVVTTAVSVRQANVLKLAS